MLVSVIIPVYNGEKYLHECLESVSACPSHEMECIIINDGSTDGTLDICNEFINRDSRFRIIDKQNSGVSDSRNKGIADAAGKYIFFLDADDYINSVHWHEIINTADTGEYDMIAYGYYCLFDSGKIHAETFPDNMCIKYALLSTTLLNPCWGKLLRREVIIENNLIFRKELRTCEDAIFILDFISIAKDFMLSNTTILYYRIHNEGVMRQASFNDKLSDFADLLAARKKYLNDNYDEKLKQSMNREFFSVITDMFRSNARDKSLPEIRRMYKENMKHDTFRSIIQETKMNYLSPFFKKMELILMRGGFYTFLAVYFRVKLSLTTLKVG